MNNPHGMVARRSHESEPPVHLLVEHGPADGFGPAGADEMRFCRYTSHIRNTKMNPLDIFDRYELRFELPDAVDVENPFLENLILRIKKTFLPLRWVGLMAQSNAGKKTRPVLYLAFSMIHSVERMPAMVSYSSMSPGLICILTRMFFPAV